MIRIGILAVSLVSFAASSFCAGFEADAGTSIQNLTVKARAGVDALKAQEAQRIAMIKKAMPSVASILVRVTVNKPSLLAKALGREYHPIVGASLGTGWVVREGLLVTNNHVVDSREIGETVVIQFSDHINRQGVVVAKNPRKDLALISFKDPSRPSMPLGSSKTLSQGQFVAAIGSPVGLRETVTAGIFSRYGFLDEIGPGRYLQIDADINHGNSGGPLVDMDGRVIGVNFAGPQLPGIGWAIPVEYVKQALRQYDSMKKLVNARLGAEFEPANWIPSSELPPIRRGGPVHETGAWLKSVPAESSADSAGLRAGDRVLSVDGVTLPEPAYDATRAIMTAIAEKDPGDSLKLLIERGGESREVVVTLAEEDDNHVP
ncbi:MAG: trypsin-like peptidase domain-containing protein [Elusimicrobiota bacterium]